MPRAWRTQVESGLGHYIETASTISELLLSMKTLERQADKMYLLQEQLQERSFKANEIVIRTVRPPNPRVTPEPPVRMRLSSERCDPRTRR